MIAREEQRDEVPMNEVNRELHAFSSIAFFDLRIRQPAEEELAKEGLQVCTIARSHDRLTPSVNNFTRTLDYDV